MDDSRRISELDIARISIVSASSRTPPEEKEWFNEFRVGEIHYTVSGFAHRKRPFGLDGDILAGLQTLFVQAGCPADNRVKVQPSALLRMTRMGDSSKEYQRMREGLLRLASVRWEMVARWPEGKTMAERTNASGLISDLWLDERKGLENPGTVQISPDGHFVVVFTATFADLIRQGLYQILDADLLARLSTPTIRTLYRALAAHRVKDGDVLTEITVNLAAWSAMLGLHSDPKFAIRTLNTAHERLMDEGYLAHVLDEGRGSQRTLTYYFQRAAEPEHVAALTQRGVGAAVAASLAADHPERVVSALRAVEEKLNSGWKPRSLPGSLVDAIRNPDKWGYTVAPKAKTHVSKQPRQVSEEEPLDPRETVRNLLLVRLGRAPSATALEGLKVVSAQELTILRKVLLEHDANLTLVESVLGGPL
ncbi:replication initiator protein A [Deinococcus sp. PESE-13]